MKLEVLDLAVIAAYFCVVVAVALFVAFVTSRKREARTSSGYFLAGRTLPWFLIAASLYATDMSSFAFIAVAGSGYLHGMLYAHYQWMAAVCLLVLAIFVLPHYLKSGIFTMPEFLKRRYGSSLENLYAFITLFIYCVIDIPVALYSASLLLGNLMDVPGWWIIIGVGVITTFYTVSGGLRAVVYMDFVQAILILGGGAYLSFKALAAVGGWGQLKAQLSPEMFHTFRPMSDPDIPWTGLCSGLLLLGLWFWTTNQSMTQRVLAGRDLNESRLGATVAGMLKFTIPFLGLVPGMCGILLYPKLAKADMVYPRLVVDLLPVGFRGLMVATLFAALMSTIDSILNSATTIFTRDVYMKWRPQADERTLVRVGRITCVAVMVLGVCLAYLPSKAELIYNYLQNMYGFFAAPVVVIFFLGIGWRRGNKWGALAALLGSIAFGVVLQLETSIRLHHRIGFSALFAVIALVVVSLLTSRPPEESLKDTTYRRGERTPFVKPFWKDYRPWVVVLVIIILSTWWTFR